MKKKAQLQIMENVSMEKLRGGFYTPQKIINFILEWSLNCNNKYDILEPGCGDGRFLEQIKKVGYKSKFGTVNVITGETVTVDVTLEPEEPQPNLIYIIAGLAIALLIIMFLMRK